MINIVSAPPPVLTNFNPYLLDPLMGIRHHVEKHLCRLYRKKIRPQDVGKRKEFDKLMKEFYEVYGRKKIEEEEYKTAIKNAPERPRISSSGGVMCFKRFQS